MKLPFKFVDSRSNGSPDTVQQRSRRMRHFRSFSNVDNFRPEVYIVMSYPMVVDLTGVKVRVKFGDSR